MSGRRGKGSVTGRSSLRSEALGIYSGIFHVYRAWWAEILVISLFIFVPLGLLDAADSSALESLRDGENFKFTALAVASLIIVATSLLGEVFLAGAIGLSLTHAEKGRPPSLRFIARHLNYGRLIAIDIAYVLIIVAGVLFLVVPGFAALVYIALAGPVAETEDRSFKGSFKRSFELVRGNFWLVFWVIVPIELFGGTVENGLESALETIFGENFVAFGLAEALANVVISPLFAIAAVLLTRRLVKLKDGRDLPGAGPADLRSGGFTRSV